MYSGGVGWRGWGQWGDRVTSHRRQDSSCSYAVRMVEYGTLLLVKAEGQEKGAVSVSTTDSPTG